MRMRGYAGPADLRAMQGLTQRIWSLSSNCHVGDQAWQRFMPSDDEWSTVLWESGDEVLAWGWAWLPGHLELLVDPAHPDLVGTVLDWFATVATAPTRTVTVTDAQKYVIDVLTERGFAPAERKSYYSYQTRELADLPEPLLPNGFTARPSTEADLDRRLAVHHAAWSNSTFTEAHYRDVMAAWPYRTDLDWIIETPDGDFAANCLIWLDDHNRVGLLEPVGTDPRFRRQGLGRAVCLAAMHAVRAAGADRAVVYPTFGHGHPGAIPLYADLGFQPYARSITYARAQH
jgi:GNAT superfamily N-acetyltransferase